jgi:hypothetical protein
MYRKDRGCALRSCRPVLYWPLKLLRIQGCIGFWWGGSGGTERRDRTPPKETLDSLRTISWFISNWRLSSQFQFSLSAVTLGYLSQWLGRTALMLCFSRIHYSEYVQKTLLITFFLSLLFCSFNSDQRTATDFFYFTSLPLPQSMFKKLQWVENM